MAPSGGGLRCGPEPPSTAPRPGRHRIRREAKPTATTSTASPSPMAPTFATRAASVAHPPGANRRAARFARSRWRSEVVADHPPAPQVVERVAESAAAARRPAGLRPAASRRRAPSPAGHERLGPGVRALVAHGDVAADLVPLAAPEPGHVAGRDAARAQQQHRRRGEELAVAGRLVEQEVLDRIDAGRRRRGPRRVASARTAASGSPP